MVLWRGSTIWKGKVTWFHRRTLCRTFQRLHETLWTLRESIYKICRQIMIIIINFEGLILTLQEDFDTTMCLKTKLWVQISDTPKVSESLNPRAWISNTFRKKVSENLSLRSDFRQSLYTKQPETGQFCSIFRWLLVCMGWEPNYVILDIESHYK